MDQYRCIKKGLALFYNKRFAEACEFFLESNRINSDCSITRHFLTESLLVTGRFKEGFEQHNRRFQFLSDNNCRPELGISPLVFGKYPKLVQCYKKPLWNGEDLTGKKILVFNEAGFGDAINFIRYIPELKKLGAYVILEVKSELKKLLECCADEVIETNMNQRIAEYVKTFTNLRNKGFILPEHDYVVSLNNFTYLFDRELANIPLKPYIFPKGTKRFTDSNKRKVGMVWAGNKKNDNDVNRSCHLKYFNNIGKLDLQLYSLQLGDMKRRWWSEEKQEWYDVDLLEGAEVDYIDLASSLKDFNDAALAINELDLVITVDTAIAHLAGAMGKLVYLLLPYYQEWRWQKDWYSGMRKIRQKRPGDWVSVFEELYIEL